MLFEEPRCCHIFLLKIFFKAKLSLLAATFLIDFMYGRGLTMLYPNLRLQRSFSTTFMERGGHSAKDGREEAIQARDRREMQPRWQPRWQPR